MDSDFLHLRNIPDYILTESSHQPSPTKHTSNQGSCNTSDILNLTTLQLWPAKAADIIHQKGLSTTKLKNKFNEIIFPWNDNYDKQRQLFSSQIQEKPLFIIFPCEEQEIIKIYTLMIKHRLTLRIIGGRHSPLLVEPDIFVVMSKFDYIRLDKFDHILKVGSYYTQGEVNNFLFQHNPNYHFPGGKINHPNLLTPAFPGGSASTVSALGISLSGGIGTLRRTLGLTIDSIISFKIVVPPTKDSRAEILIAEKHRHEDLFWALRGAGNQNFGFITEITYQIDIVSAVILYEINWKYTESTARNVLKEWQQNSVYLSNQFNEDLSFFTNNLNEKDSPGKAERGFPEQGINVTGIYVLKFGQSVKSAQKDVKKNTYYLLKLGGTMLIDELSSYQDVYIKFVQARVYHNFSLGKTVFTRKNLSDEILIPRMREAKKVRARSLIGLQLMGGKISDVSPKGTSFYPRCAKFFIDIFNHWDSVVDQAGSEAWNRETFRIIHDENRPFSYIGFPVSGLTPINYYGKNLPRLEEIKKKYDPLNLLKYPDSL